MDRSAPLRLTSAPQSLRMLTSVSTSVMRGTSLMMSGSSVKSPAARIGSTGVFGRASPPPRRSAAACGGSDRSPRRHHLGKPRRAAFGSALSCSFPPVALILPPRMPLMLRGNVFQRSSKRRSGLLETGFCLHRVRGRRGGAAAGGSFFLDAVRVRRAGCTAPGKHAIIRRQFTKGPFAMNRFVLKDPLSAQRRPARGHRIAGQRRFGRKARPGAAGCDRQRQDLHHGVRHRKGAEATLVLAHNKDAGGPAVQRAAHLLPGQRGGVFRQLLRLLPARSLHRLHDTTSKRMPPSTRRSTACATRPPPPCASAAT